MMMSNPKFLSSSTSQPLQPSEEATYIKSVFIPPPTPTSLPSAILPSFSKLLQALQHSTGA